MKIYDGSKIIPGVVIFFAVISLPFWYNAVSSQAAETPQITINTQAKQCIEPEQWMIDHHMQLLNTWRDDVVRKDINTYTASNGEQYTIGLATCASCHPDRTDFCDQCHNYIDVSPSCWECHNLPEGETSASK